MQHTFERQIGDHKVTVSHFPATEGLMIIQKIMRTLGPAVGELATQFVGDEKKSIGDVDISGDAIAKAVDALVSGLDEQENVQLVKRMMKQTLIGDQEIGDKFDVMFMGRYGLMMKILAFIMEVNYKNFFVNGDG